MRYHWFAEVDQLRGLNGAGIRARRRVIRDREAARSECADGVDFAGTFRSRFVVLMQSGDWATRAGGAAQVRARSRARAAQAIERALLFRYPARRHGRCACPTPGSASCRCCGRVESRHGVVAAAKHAAQKGSFLTGSAIEIDREHANAYPQCCFWAANAAARPAGSRSEHVDRSGTGSSPAHSNDASSRCSALAPCREGRTLVALGEEKNPQEARRATSYATRSPRHRHRGGAQEGALIDDVERRLGDGGEEILQSNQAACGGSARAASGASGLKSIEHVPSAFGEEAHVSASRREQAPCAPRPGRPRASAAGDLPASTARSARP